MKNKLIVSLSVVILLVFCSVAVAATLTFNYPNSNYRKIDKTGATSPFNEPKLIIKGVGIGNVIFSSSPMEKGQESSYANIGTSFTYAQIKDMFQARAYFPARIRDLIAYVGEKYPGYKFKKDVVEVDFSIYAPSMLGGAKKGTLENTMSSEEELGRDQLRAFILPMAGGNFSYTNPERIFSSEKGEFKVTIGYYLTFETPNGKNVTSWDSNGNKITQYVPFTHNFLIAYGECTVKN